MNDVIMIFSMAVLLFGLGVIVRVVLIDPVIARLSGEEIYEERIEQGIVEP